MNWESFIIGLGGLLLGAFTSYLAYLSRKDERTSYYRQALYEKQFDKCIIIAEMAHEIKTTLGEIFNLKDEKLAYLKKEKMDEVYKSENEYYLQHRQSLILFPAETSIAINSFGFVANRIRKMYSSQKPVEDTKLEEALQDLKLKYKSLVVEIRMVIGTDPLSKETLKLLGVEKESED